MAYPTYVVSVWSDGADPERDAPALRVPSGARGTVIGRVRREGGYSSIDFEPDRIIDALWVLKASQAPEWIARWGADLDAIVAAIDNGRGRNPSPERARCFELLDEEVAAGRDPYDRKLARVIANNLMVDSSRVRDWRKDWAKEREYDGN